MSMAFVIHANPDHPHQMSVRMRTERANPAALVSLRMSEATCVIAKTKTRSKKSSR